MGLLNLVRMTSGTTGTGTLTLGSTVQGFLSMSEAGAVNGATYSYAIEADYVTVGDELIATSREVGRGVYTASGTTLTRSVLESTNGGAALVLTGDEQVLITALAEDFDELIPDSSTVGQVLRVTGANTYAWGALDLADADAITGDLPYANLTASGSASKLLGRGDSGAGDWQEITLGSNLSMTGTTLAATGGGTAASTTEVLTGTDTAKMVTPDALAALWEKGSNVASAATVSLGEGGYFHITGTTTITDIDFATAKDGRVAVLQFDGTLTLTHNATTLALPGNANITTAAGDCAIVVQDASDNVKCVSYVRAAAPPVSGTNTGDQTLGGLGGAASSVTLTAGSGLTGGGDLTTNRTFTVGAGTGVIVNADDVTLDFGKKAIWIPAMAGQPYSNSPCDFGSITARTGVEDCWDFGPTNNAYAGYTLSLPNSWDKGNISFRVFWGQASGTGDVVWIVYHAAYADGEDYDTSTPSSNQLVVDTAATAGNMHVTAESSAFAIAGSPGANELVHLFLGREPTHSSDTFTGTAKLIGFMVYYTVNTLKDN